ncbi:MAG: hypothetical protein CM15mP31_5150 [Gammaproteobacteria bacterium]|nr:MAG: hypothetical protein CM15mP31_5150 [Gammaproteobacteria bacterium]
MLLIDVSKFLKKFKTQNQIFKIFLEFIQK